jgi:DNA transposition AAA+ family ATPase
MSDGQKAIDRLNQEARVLGPTRVIRDADPSKVTREQAEQVAEAVKAFRARTNVSLAFIARALGISAGTLSDVLRFVYAGNWRQVYLDLDRWLEDEHKREAAPKPTSFVWTRVAEEIRTVAEAAVTLKTIGLVYGPSGVGKSLALHAIHADKPGSVLISIETAAATGPGIIEALAKAVRAGTSGSRYVSARYVLERERRAGRLAAAHHPGRSPQAVHGHGGQR